MLRAAKAKSSKTVASKGTDVQILLKPVAAFLRKSGFPKSMLIAEWRVAVNRPLSSKSRLKVVRIGSDFLDAGVVSRWLRDPTYLNHAGRPVDLPLRGERSISALMKAEQVPYSPSKMLALLIEFGTVTKVGATRYRLIRQSLNYVIPEYLPFEPNFRFLVDAAHACSGGAGVTSQAPRLFWHTAASTKIQRKHFPAFLQFANQRGLLLMREIDDWLESHEVRKAQGTTKAIGTKNMRRIGLGLFGICADLK